MTLQTVCQFVGKFVAQAEVKVAAGLVGAILGYFLPTSALQDMTVVAGILVIMDTITGVAASYNSGDAIKSARFSRVLSKILVYSCVIGAVSVAFKALPGALPMREPAVSAVIGMIIVTELISIIENADRMDLKIVPKWIRNIVREQQRRFERKPE